MKTNIRLALSLAIMLLVVSGMSPSAPACCPATREGQPVVNADQTVIIIWDAETKTQHFIRQASFKSDAKDFGFLIPSPTQPELNESGNDAFPMLLKLTEPVVQRVKRPKQGLSCGCSKSEEAATDTAPDGGVTVLEEKLVAGFQAAVLEATSASELIKWLSEHNYAFSPEVEAWAQPYVENGWKITALKVASEKVDEYQKNVAAPALRMTFQTDRPLFPYREPDPRQFAEQLNATNRLLRIYFIGEARYEGELTAEQAWTSRVAWAGKLQSTDRKKLLEKLQLPEDTGPSQWWLTELEHDWPYEVAPADVYFSRSSEQSNVRRPPIIEYVSSPLPTDATVYAFVALAAAIPIFRRKRLSEK